MNRHPEGVWPVLPGVRFFTDLGGLAFLFVVEYPGDFIGVPLLFNFGVFLYFITRRFDSGVLPHIPWLLETLLGVLEQRRAGERPTGQQEPGLGVGLVANICQRSTGAVGTCLSLMSSFSWASLSIFLCFYHAENFSKKIQSRTPFSV